METDRLTVKVGRQTVLEVYELKTDRQTLKKVKKHTNRQTDTQTDRQTDLLSQV